MEAIVPKQTKDAGIPTCRIPGNQATPVISKLDFSRIGEQKSVESTKRGRLTHKSKASWPDSNACTRIASGFVWSSIYLLLLLAMTPVTERLWIRDRLFQRDRDFKPGIVMLLSWLCLTLVVSKQCNQCVESLLSKWYIPVFNCHDHVAPRIYVPGHLSIFHPEPRMGPAPGMDAFPLQI